MTYIKTGLLLVNLGTPEAPTPKAVRRYLAEFLGDPFVVDKPRWLWWPILHGVILRLRPKKSAHAYQKIWTEQGSPLLINSQKLAEKVQAVLGETYVVKLAMRYGKPSISQALEAFEQAGVTNLTVLPLYPQYSRTTTETTFHAIERLIAKHQYQFALNKISSYQTHAAYIEALAAQIRAHWQQHGRSQLLMLSYHGLPKRMVQQGDPYYQHCCETTQALVQALDLKPDEWVMSFQSRVGVEDWLQPYTDAMLRELAQQGTHSVQVICPGFAVDCLETLEEIDMQNRELFLKAGGKLFQYIPALNRADSHAAMLKSLTHMAV